MDISEPVAKHSKQNYYYSRYKSLKITYFQTCEDTVEETLSNSILERFKNVSITDIVSKWFRILKIVNDDLFEVRGLRLNISEFLFHLKQRAIYESVLYKSEYSVRKEIFLNFPEGFLFLFDHLEPVTYTVDLFVDRTGRNFRAFNQVCENVEPFLFMYTWKLPKDLNLIVFNTKMKTTTNTNNISPTTGFIEDKTVEKNLGLSNEMALLDNNAPEFQNNNKRRKVFLDHGFSNDSLESADQNKDGLNHREVVLLNDKEKNMSKSLNHKRKWIKSSRNRRMGLRSMQQNLIGSSLQQVDFKPSNVSLQNLENNNFEPSQITEKALLFYGFQDKSDETINDDKILNIYLQNVTSIKRKTEKNNKIKNNVMARNFNRNDKIIKGKKSKINSNKSEKLLSDEASVNMHKSGQSLTGSKGVQLLNKVPCKMLPVVLLERLNPTILKKFKIKIGLGLIDSSIAKSLKNGESNSVEATNYDNFHRSPELGVSEVGTSSQPQNIKRKQGRPKKDSRENRVESNCTYLTSNMEQGKLLQLNEAHKPSETSNVNSAEAMPDSLGDPSSPQRDFLVPIAGSMESTCNPLRSPSSVVSDPEKLSRNPLGDSASFKADLVNNSKSLMLSNNITAHERPVALAENAHNNIVSDPAAQSKIDYDPRSFTKAFDLYVQKNINNLISSRIEANSIVPAYNDLKEPSRTVAVIAESSLIKDPTRPVAGPSEPDPSMSGSNRLVAGPSKRDTNDCKHDTFNNPQPCSSNTSNGVQKKDPLKIFARPEATSGELNSLQNGPDRIPYDSLFQQHAFPDVSDDSEPEEFRDSLADLRREEPRNNDRADGCDEEDAGVNRPLRNHIVNQREQVIDIQGPRLGFNERNLNATIPSSYDIIRNRPVQYNCMTMSQMFEIRNHQPQWFSGFMRQYHNSCNYKVNEMRKLVKELMDIENVKVQLMEQIMSYHNNDDGLF